MVLDSTLDAALLFVVNREGVTTSSRAGTDLSFPVRWWSLWIVIIEPLLYISVKLHSLSACIATYYTSKAYL